MTVFDDKDMDKGYDNIQVDIDIISSIGNNGDQFLKLQWFFK